MADNTPGASGSARRDAARRHHRGRHADRGLALDQEQSGQTRPGDAVIQEGQSVVFRDEGNIGVDTASGLVHTAGVTTGSVHDAKVMDELIREDDRAVYGDKGYASDRKKALARAAGVLWAVKEKAKPGQPLTGEQRASNRTHGSMRAKVEHVSRVLKCQFGYRKVRYRGIAKNGARVFALLALANLYLARGKLRLA